MDTNADQEADCVFVLLGWQSARFSWHSARTFLRTSCGFVLLGHCRPFLCRRCECANRSGPKQRHEIEQACESKRRRARGGDRDLATRRRCVITTVSSSKRGSCSSHGTRAMRCRCDANAVVGAPAKSRSKRVWKSIFSLLESFLALLPQKRNFRFLFLNQCKLQLSKCQFEKVSE